MKKLVMIAALMVAAVSAKAQYEPGTFSIQPKVGFTVSNLTNMPSVKTISNNTSIDNTVTAGAIAGVDAEYQVIPQLGLSVGVNYSMQGSGWDDYELKASDGNVKLSDAKIELGYINIPIVANIYLFKGFALKSGVQFGFLTNAKEKYTLESHVDKVNTKTEVDEDIKSECEKMDLSIPIGASYEFNNHLVLDARYNLGLKKVFKDGGYSGKDSKNGVFLLTIGYKIEL